MNNYLCMLLPSIIGLVLYEKLDNKTNKMKEIIYIYLLMILFVNFISTFICVVIFDLKIGVDCALTDYPLFALKYIILSIVISIVISIIIKWIEKNIKIELSVENNEKKNKSKKK